ncbi:PTS transporter subunit IIABC [Proteiniclasticum ruminis]|uniref:PTS system D-glucosamine-specific IIA component, Glc family /PTS system D-glucosamine-specific IIB component, Glc family /PTS system D-glucosamine-specific IIC component, Glc family n=1 Tax=Proteiniclasticum ruminis TaxID=398199 RepID=A0A1I5CT06_9CLOT|nr:PTS transporter subunit IIABC [Proteiniclasticum ruminis]SFN89986.1 PTS system D-glucosamine-specific IIA component, Glc family /PTS system D-glucosamine-specific IIB component, Glc family /PTS system D-glucosamine-specific IIC component, Glc family [Proteiniclasticum ruminis]
MKTKKKSGGFFAILQKVGKSLMLPVSVLPAAGLMVALSRIIEQLAGAETLANSPVLDVFVKVLFSGGLIVFENLPLIFAVGVAIGFTAGEAVSGLAAVVGYVVLIKVLDIMSAAQNLVDPINMGVFSGIIIGIIAAKIYQRYFKTKLHPVLGFFEGKRLVPIIMVVVSILLGVALGFVWPPIQNGINALGQMAIDAEIFGFRLGGAIYAFGNRALIPTGLHHVFKTPFTTQFGTYVAADGQTYVGEIARFFAGDPTAGAITAAEYPLKIFGLPAAALAIYLRALPKNKKAIGGVMLTAALTSIITGITEPIEFAFMFVAPVLYIAHISLAFVGGLLMNLFGVRLTETFTSSLIDYVVSITTGNAGNPWMLLPVGLVIGALYFAAFYFLIKKLDLKTPGRDTDEIQKEAVPVTEKAVEVLKALGSANNIKAIDACITRLRLEVFDTKKVDKNRLKALGSPGVLEVGQSGIQVIFGTEAEALKDEIKVIMENPDSVTVVGVESKAKEGVAGSSVTETIMASPVKGKVLDLSEVPDALFAEKMIGDGFAIDPQEGTVVSPVRGEIAHIFDTNHALAFITESGLEVLLHIGIDTVKMEGRGFKRLAEIGQKVEIGTPLMEVDWALVRQEAKSSITEVVVTNMDQVHEMKVIASGLVDPSQDVLIVK